MVRIRSLSKPEPDQATAENPFKIFIPDSVKDQISHVKKKDSVLCEQLKKRFKKLRRDPECGKVLRHDKAGHREVHVKDYWVVVYQVDYDARTVVIVKIGIHDKVLGA
jgi:addiction module RelE/StbE family toxin